MAETGLVSSEALQDIADAIRDRSGSQKRYKPADMGAAIRTMEVKTTKPRALLLDDGTLEFNCLDSPRSATGGNVLRSYEIPLSGYQMAAERPWSWVAGKVRRAVFDATLLDSGITTCAHWLEGCSAMREASGLESLQNVGDFTGLFNGCHRLESIYATSFDPSGKTGTDVLRECNQLVGNAGIRPTQTVSSDVGELTVGDGIVVDPAADARTWAYWSFSGEGKVQVSASGEPMWNSPFDIASEEKPDEIQAGYLGRSCVQASYGAAAGFPAGDAYSIDTVEILGDMADLDCGVSMANWFAMAEPNSIAGIANLKNITSMEGAFSHCGCLQEVDLTGVDPSHIGNFDTCFAGCDSLKTIWADDSWTLPEGTRGIEAFDGCDSLVGGNGTEYSFEHSDGDYARVDKEGAPGYFTARATASNGGKEEASTGTPEETGQDENEGSSEAAESAQTPAPTKKARALLLDDGTLELTYLDSAESPSGGTVKKEYEVSPDGYETAADRPWHADRDEIKKSVIDTSLADSGILNISYWFSNMSQLEEVFGMENLQAATRGTALFYCCTKLRSIWSKSYESRFFGDSCNRAFTGCDRLVGGHLGVPGSQLPEKCFTTGENGLLADPEDDKRVWVNSWLYSDGTLCITRSGGADATRSLVSGGSVCANASYGNRFGFPWAESRDIIERVEFADDMAGISGLSMKYWLSNANSPAIAFSGWENVHPANLESFMSCCSYVMEVDLRGLDASTVVRWKGAFCGMSELNRIYVDESWSLAPSLVSDSGMFLEDEMLVGGAGTVQDPSKTGASMAVIDHEGSPGYMTAKSDSAPLEMKKLRALLLDDGTMEVVYQSSTESPSGGTVAKDYTISLQGYESTEDRPWDSDGNLVKRVIVHPSVRERRVKDITGWFAYMFNLTEVSGFENLSGIREATRCFASCRMLTTIWAKGFDGSKISERCQTPFIGCIRLVGGHRLVEDGFTDKSHFTTGEGGLLADPSSDERVWATARVYGDGTLDISRKGSVDAAKKLVGEWSFCVNARYKEVAAIPWVNCRDDIRAVKLSEDLAEVPNLSMDLWFRGFQRSPLKLSGLQNVHPVSWEQRFRGSTATETLDLRGLDPSTITRWEKTFYSMWALKTILVDGTWSLPTTLASRAGAFDGDPKLVGGNRTAYDEAKVGAEMAVIDKEGQPGYLTAG